MVDRDFIKWYSNKEERGNLVKVICQRVLKASVTINHQLHSEIAEGLLLLVGITETDTKECVEKMAKKIAFLRIFEDENGKMNQSILEKEGMILSVSQFTLYADCRKGRRPSFNQSAEPKKAKEFIDYFHECLRKYVTVKEGIFGEDMKVELINDGPVTLVLDTQELGYE